VLLVYFLGVVGTGIFWVAAQELPVFDWHYLLGYLFLAIVVAHFVLNRKQVAAFVRRGAPAALRDPSGRRFRRGVRTTAATAGIAAVAAVAFLAGGRYGSSTVKVVAWPDSGSRPPEAGAGGFATGRIPPTLLEASGETMPLAVFYHRGSSYPARVPLAGVTFAVRPEVYKRYPDAPRVPLPRVRPATSPSVLEAASMWRSGCTRLARSTMTLDDLALLLDHAQGITSELRTPNGTFDLRAAPSAGALYPIDLYVVASRVEGLAPGLYHYAVKDHELVRLREGEIFGELEAAAGSPHLYEPAAATVVLTATFARTGFKYKERCYRYVCMDAGHVAFNLALSAAAHGLAAPVVARFDDDAMHRLLGLAPGEEGALLLVPLGRAAERLPRGPLPEPRFAVEGTGMSPSLRFLDLVHGGTSLRRLEGWSDAPTRVADDEPAGGLGEAIPLPEPSRGLDLLPTIRERRSVRNHSAAPIEPEELAALIEAAVGGTPEGDPFLAATAPVVLRAVVRDVRGIAPGVYRVDPGRRALRLVREGEFADRCREATLHQDFCGTADVVFVKSVRWDAMLRADGDRGYRYACIRAGMVGGGIYLQGTALGIGVCGVGAFGDGDVAGIVGCDPDVEAILYLTAAGR